MIKKAFVLALVLLGCFFPQEVLAEDTTIESVVAVSYTHLTPSA